MWNETLRKFIWRRTPCSWNNEGLCFPGNSCESMRSQKPTKRLQTDDSSLVTRATADLASQSMSSSTLGFVCFTFAVFFSLVVMVMRCSGQKGGAVSTTSLVELGAEIKESLSKYIVTWSVLLLFYFYWCIRFPMILLQAPNFIDHRRRSGLRIKVFMADDITEVMRS